MTRAKALRELAMIGEALTHQAGPDVQARYSVTDQARHPNAQKLLAFWAARPADGLVMGRDVPSRAVADLLSNISILAPTPDRSDMSVRLAGASYIKRHGRDVKGRMMSELYPPNEFRDHMKSLLGVIDSGNPLIVDSRLEVCGTVSRLNFEVVVLPILSPDRRSLWILSSMFYFD